MIHVRASLWYTPIRIIFQKLYIESIETTSSTYIKGAFANFCLTVDMPASEEKTKVIGEVSIGAG